MSVTPKRFTVASNCSISPVSPLADMANSASPRTIMPRSPCRASAGCKYRAGVPVELRVAATLRAISPLFPIPVTTTRPLQPYSRSIERSKSCAIGPAMRSARARSASASIRTTFAAMFFMRAKMLASGKSSSLRLFWRHCPVGVEDQYAFLVGASRQWNRLSVERNLHRASVASPEDNLIVGVDRLHVGRDDDTSHNKLTIRLDRDPGIVFGTDRHLE